MSETVKIGTRSSRLALTQSQLVANLLNKAWPQVNPILVHFSTKGDRTLGQALPEIGGKGLFTAELEQALLQNEIDLAVHSLKDLPVAQRDGLTLGAVVSRADARDCLVAKHGWTMATLPRGAIVGTSSPRRRAQALALRPDLEVRPVRGNVETRIRRALEEDYDAVILAVAGVQRLGLADTITEILPIDKMLPAPGQGALGVQCRADDLRILRLLASVNSAATRLVTQAERQFLELLGGGCTAPVGAYATSLPDGSIQMHIFAALDNRQPVWGWGKGLDPEQLSEKLADKVLAPDGSKTATTRTANTPVTLARLPLHDKRVVITRSTRQAHSMIKALKAQGATVILAPVVQVAPLDDLTKLGHALDHLSDYRWIVFTSANAVRVFMSELAQRRLDASRLESCQIAAVGPATADALANAGIRTSFVPEVFLGSQLAASLAVSPGDRVLLPRAMVANPEAPNILAERGALVDDIPIYRTVPTSLEEAVVRTLAQGVDVVTFASGSAVRGFHTAISKHSQIASLLDQSTIACIGPRTADVVLDLGYKASIVAETHTSEGLVEAIVRHFESERQ